MFIKNIIKVIIVKPPHTMVFHFDLQACELPRSLPAITLGHKDII